MGCRSAPQIDTRCGPRGCEGHHTLSLAGSPHPRRPHCASLTDGETEAPEESGGDPGWGWGEAPGAPAATERPSAADGALAPQAGLGARPAGGPPWGWRAPAPEPARRFRSRLTAAGRSRGSSEIPSNVQSMLRAAGRPGRGLRAPVTCPPRSRPPPSRRRRRAWGERARPISGCASASGSRPGPAHPGRGSASGFTPRLSGAGVTRGHPPFTRRRRGYWRSPRRARPRPRRPHRL